jgi:hypothetical protein
LLGKINLFVGNFFGIHCTSENANVLLQLNVCDRIREVFCEFKVDDAFGIMYSQFWMQPNTIFYFLHINVIKKHYCELKKMKPSID